MDAREVAMIAGVTPERILQIEAVALRKLARKAAVIRLEREWRR